MNDDHYSGHWLYSHDIGIHKENIEIKVSLLFPISYIYTMCITHVDHGPSIHGCLVSNAYFLYVLRILKIHTWILKKNTTRSCREKNRKFDQVYLFFSASLFQCSTNVGSLNGIESIYFLKFFNSLNFQYLQQSLNLESNDRTTCVHKRMASYSNIIERLDNAYVRFSMFIDHDQDLIIR